MELATHYREIESTTLVSGRGIDSLSKVTQAPSFLLMLLHWERYNKKSGRMKRTPPPHALVLSAGEVANALKLLQKVTEDA